MASVKKQPNGRYQVRWRSLDGRPGKKTFQRKVDADQYRTFIENSMLTGVYVDPAAGRKTFKAYAESWRGNQVQHRAGTSSQIETNLRRHVYPVLGSRPIATIQRSEVQALVKELSLANRQREALAPSTVKIIYTWVSTIFKSAVNDRIIAVSPCRDINLPGNCSGPLTGASTTWENNARTVGNSNPRSLL